MSTPRKCGVLLALSLATGAAFAEAPNDKDIDEIVSFASVADSESLRLATTAKIQPVAFDKAALADNTVVVAAVAPLAPPKPTAKANDE